MGIVVQNFNIEQKSTVWWQACPDGIFFFSRKITTGVIYKISINCCQPIRYCTINTAYLIRFVKCHKETSTSGKERSFF